MGNVFVDSKSVSLKVRPHINIQFSNPRNPIPTLKLFNCGRIRFKS
jgi:hypothetical protein